MIIATNNNHKAYKRLKNDEDLIDYYVVFNIVNLMEEKNLSVNQLALISDISQSTLDAIIKGETKNPKLLTIIKICDGLEISLKDFFDI